MSCSSAGTVLEAIEPAGNDFTDFGKRTTRVTVVHPDGTSESMELRKIRADPSLDLELLPGDKIYTFPEETPPQWQPAPPESKPGLRADAPRLLT